MESVRRYLIKLTGPGVRAVRRAVGIILVKSRARVLDGITEVIVLVLNAVGILHFRLGITLDLSDGRLNNRLWDGCEDNRVTVRVRWVDVRNICRSEWNVRRVAGIHGGTVIGGRRGVWGEWTIDVVGIAARGGTERRAINVWIEIVQNSPRLRKPIRIIGSDMFAKLGFTGAALGQTCLPPK